MPGEDRYMENSAEETFQTGGHGDGKDLGVGMRTGFVQWKCDLSWSIKMEVFGGSTGHQARRSSWCPRQRSSVLMVT